MSNFSSSPFIVTVWLRETAESDAQVEQLASIAGIEPDETTRYEGMVDSHWSFTTENQALACLDALKLVLSWDDLVLLKLSGMAESFAPIVLKDARHVRH